MKRNLSRPGNVCLGITALLLWTGMVFAGASLQAPEDELVIAGKKPARFAHKTHLALGLDCGVCHHNEEHEPLNAQAIAGLEDPAGLRCVSCHNDTHPDKELQGAKDVFHARCKTCHTEGYAGKNGPTGCTGCHIKSNKKALEGC